MNPLIHLKKITLPILITVAFVCFGLLPQATAVTPNVIFLPPPPDGCYPNFTTAEGCNALNSLTSGIGNTALGWRSLFFNTEGSFNTGVGGGALALNNADSNTAVGAAALLLNTSGIENTAVGTDAMVSNTTGSRNVANGANALLANTTGGGNVANGDGALFANTTGGGNVANGLRALQSNTTGLQNVANGTNALNANTTGSDNVANGRGALASNTTGNGNTALGALAGSAAVTANNIICIGANVAGANVSNTTWVGNIYGVTTQNGTTAPVIVSADGQLGTIASSERFKKDIATMEKASEAILSLRPVTFHYKTDTTATPQFGLIAEEVAKVNPALVLPDKEGKPYTVRYDAVNAMLLNEFLKEHKKVENLKNDFQATVAQQQKEIAALTAMVKEQAAQIQKVSAQLELSKSAPRTVLNSQ